MVIGKLSPPCLNVFLISICLPVSCLRDVFRILKITPLYLFLKMYFITGTKKKTTFDRAAVKK